MTTTVATDYDNIEIQQQYSDVNNRWDVDDWDNENSSARLFERSRIKALAGPRVSLACVVMMKLCGSLIHSPAGIKEEGVLIDISSSGCIPGVRGSWEGVGKGPVPGKRLLLREGGCAISLRDRQKLRLWPGTTKGERRELVPEWRLPGGLRRTDRSRGGSPCAPPARVGLPPERGAGAGRPEAAARLMGAGGSAAGFAPCRSRGLRVWRNGTAEDVQHLRAAVARLLWAGAVQLQPAGRAVQATARGLILLVPTDEGSKFTWLFVKGAAELRGTRAVACWAKAPEQAASLLFATKHAGKSPGRSCAQKLISAIVLRVILK
ncbi:Spectrin beta chain, non-erythrocytic 1 [Galemys pyrenaicus]|uniref:Spectrin beta chain, non-erythrocytic 1 n=1 Tax=Galemys pyrenaicus TaxID=202257 RepID=A0A8J6DN35_GALPY|nr:Spectrin beta chain, non-erythrocytic 1 [Galemys pyrenaicus]